MVYSRLAAPFDGAISGEGGNYQLFIVHINVIMFPWSRCIYGTTPVSTRNRLLGYPKKRETKIFKIYFNFQSTDQYDR